MMNDKRDGLRTASAPMRVRARMRASDLLVFVLLTREENRKLAADKRVHVCATARKYKFRLFISRCTLHTVHCTLHGARPVEAYKCVGYAYEPLSLSFMLVVVFYHLLACIHSNATMLVRKF